MPPVTAIPLDRFPVLARHARFLDFSFALERPGEQRVASIRKGEVSWTIGPAQHCEFTIRASAATWEEFGKPHPRPGFHDLFALVEGGHAHLSGDVFPFFQNLLLVKAVAAAMCGREFT